VPGKLLHAGGGPPSVCEGESTVTSLVIASPPLLPLLLPLPLLPPVSVPPSFTGGGGVLSELLEHATAAMQPATPLRRRASARVRFMVDVLSV
jgi:hypothetical protein